eukprot:356009-Chlamydomonas_euryale.AAC.2
MADASADPRVRQRVGARCTCALATPYTPYTHIVAPRPRAPRHDPDYLATPVPCSTPRPPPFYRRL